MIWIYKYKIDMLLGGIIVGFVLGLWAGRIIP